MENYIVKKTISVDAEPNEVWDALTDPEKTKQYFFNCRVHSDWKKGSTITFKGRILFIKKIEMSGVIVEILPQKLLKYELSNGSDGESKSIVTDTLTYHRGVTTLTITDDVGQGEGAEDRYNRSIKGWDKVLGGLKKLVEETNFATR